MKYLLGFHLSRGEKAFGLFEAFEMVLKKVGFKE